MAESMRCAKSGGMDLRSRDPAYLDQLLISAEFVFTVPPAALAPGVRPTVDIAYIVKLISGALLRPAASIKDIKTHTILMILSL